jgi:zinc protease
MVSFALLTISPRRLCARYLPLIAIAIILICASPQRALAFGKIQQLTTPAGINVWLVQDKRLPMLTMDFAFTGGAATDPEDKQGLAYMASTLLDEGADGLSATAFQTALEDHGIILQFNTTQDHISGTLKTITDEQERAFEYLRKAIQAPEFTDSAIARLRGQILSQLRYNEKNPNYLATRTFVRQIYQGHPYSRPTKGTTETINTITRADLQTFARRAFAKDNLTIAVVGDISADALLPLIDHAFAALPAHTQLPPIPAAEPRPLPHVQVVDLDIPQSIATFGHMGISRRDPDWYGAYVLNYILGGGSFNSRLMENVREKNGLAYSVYSYLLPYQHGALILGGVATQNEKISESIALIKQEWHRMATEGPTDIELKNAKTYLTGAWPLRFTSTSGISNTLLAMQLFDLPPSYLEKRNALINALTKADLQRIAKKLFNTKALSFVIVGKPDGIQPQQNTTPRQ